MNYRTITPVLLCLAILGGDACALTAKCPEKIQKNPKGYFYSNEVPGWRALKPSPKDATVNNEDFGGAIYSPEHHRIACIYRTNQKKWVALVSHVSHAFSQDDLDLKSWKYSAKRKFFVCGTPQNTYKECTFKISDKK